MSNIARNQTFFHRHLKTFVLSMMLNNRSEIFLGKTHKSILSFITYFRRFSETPLPPFAKRHTEIHVKDQIKHDNLLFGHRLATGPTLHSSGYRPKPSINFIVHHFICSP